MLFLMNRCSKGVLLSYKYVLTQEDLSVLS